MKIMKASFLVLLICMQVQAGSRSRAAAKATTQAKTMAGNAQAGNGTTSTSYETLEQSSKDTTKNSQKGQTIATVMKIGMYAAGATYASMCKPPASISPCVKAAVMFMMGGQAAKSAKSFQSPIDTSWQNSCTYSTLGCGKTPSNPYDAVLTPDEITTAKANEEKIAQALSKSGYAVDIETGKIKTPKGEINGNDPAALGAEGMNLNGQIASIEKDAKAKVDSIKGAAVTAALGFDGGGGGANVGALGEGGYGTDEDSKGAGGLASKIDKLRSPAAKGLTKNFNGDPIGVAADSIFEMMSRRYQLKNTQKTFLGAEIQSN